MLERSRANLPQGIDLLWSHQIRRENTLLHKQVQQLQARIDEIQDLQSCLSSTVESLQVDSAACSSRTESVQAQVDIAEAKLTRYSDLATSTSLRVDQVSADLASTSKSDGEKIQKLSERVDDVHAYLCGLEEDGEKRTNKLAQDLQQLSANIDGHQQQPVIDALLARMSSLEARIDRCTCSSDTPRLANNCDREATKLRGSYDESADSVVTNTVSSSGPGSQEEPMLTLQDVEDKYPTLTPEPSIDLDENVATPSYAAHQRPQSRVPESLQPIVLSSPRIAARPNYSQLKQGRYHSWDRYLAEAQTLIKTLPHDQEKEAVSTVLEHNGWTWDSVVSYGMSGTPALPLAATTRPTVARKSQASAQVPHEHPPDSSLTRTSAPVEKRRGKDAEATVPSSERRDGRPVVPVQEPRRSQRLAGIAAHDRPKKRQNRKIGGRTKPESKTAKANQVKLRPPTQITEPATSNDHNKDFAIPPSHQPEREVSYEIPMTRATSAQSAETQTPALPSTPPSKLKVRSRPGQPSAQTASRPSGSIHHRQISSSSDIVTMLNDRTRIASRRLQQDIESEEGEPQLPRIPTPPPAPRKISRLPTLIRNNKSRATLAGTNDRKHQRQPTSVDHAAPVVKRVKKVRRPPPKIPILPTSEL
ncbi:uncharacterized protein AB675_8043 [Cyphellophora attinorum]|uniref:Uncharacterized protein n=1 Tax=Cyphellophora attinorum TaxID=1664694 RepID=A0A0N1H5Q8_9EURO|nr:uncharacterized protein AB675_8043 [Phialophora attinorum]KPI41142.1 hypothetical protein AB675_8043 [Phialophora attinorum]